MTSYPPEAPGISYPGWDSDNSSSLGAVVTTVIDSQNPTDITVGNYDTGAILTDGGISVAKSIQSGGRIYTNLSTLSQVGVSSVNDQNSGLHFIANDEVGLVAGAQVRVGATLSGAYCTGNFSVGQSSVGSNRLSVTDSSTATATSLVVANSSSGHSRNVIQTASTGVPYWAFDNAVYGCTHGMLTDGTYAIGSGSGNPNSKTNAITVTQSNIVDLLTSARINGMTLYCRNVQSSGNLISGSGGLVITSSPVALSYNLVRIGAVMTLHLNPNTVFAVTTPGTTAEIDLYSILNSNGYTINSMPAAVGGYNSGDKHFFQPMSILRNNGSFEVSLATYITGLNGSFSSMRLLVVAGANFSGTVNYLLGGTISWVCRSDSL